MIYRLETKRVILMPPILVIILVVILVAIIAFRVWSLARSTLCCTLPSLHG